MTIIISPLSWFIFYTAHSDKWVHLSNVHERRLASAVWDLYDFKGMVQRRHWHFMLAQQTLKGKFSEKNVDCVIWIFKIVLGMGKKVILKNKMALESLSARIINMAPTRWQRRSIMHICWCLTFATAPVHDVLANIVRLSVHFVTLLADTLILGCCLLFILIVEAGERMVSKRRQGSAWCCCVLHLRCTSFVHQPHWRL